MAKTWKIADDANRQSWTIIAPDDATEAEVHQYAAENADSWTNGGTYRMELDTEATSAAPQPTEGKPAKTDYDRAVATLDRQLADLNKRRVAQGGPGNQLGGRPLTPDPALDAEIQKLTDLREQFAIGAKGATVGGVGGALAGAAIFGSLGLLTGPAAPVATPILALIGSIVGGAGGTAAGTHLWDIPAARETREVTDQEAAELIKQRAIESLIWDGAFVLILGPGGRAIGKMTKGAKFLPALKAAAKESMGWDEIMRIREKQLLSKIEKRATQSPSGLSTQVSRALDVPTLQTDREATEVMLLDMARRSGGKLPTPGEMTGIIEGTEAFARRQAPTPFFKNDKILSETAVDIRRSALQSLDKAGAATGPDLGMAVKGVAESADRTIKRVTAPIFEKARRQTVAADISPVIKVIDDALSRVERSAGRMGGISKSEVADLQATREMLMQSGTGRMWIDGLQDFISGNKAAARKIAPDGTQPTEYYNKVLGDMTRAADAAYLSALRGVKDKTLVEELRQARKLYGETMSDLYTDSMARLADKRQEAYGAALTGKGHVTEIRELRAALDRAAAQAPARPRYKGTGSAQELTEQSASMLKKERKRIDAGMIKGFIEKHTQSLENLEDKLLDPDFRLTLKELLTGKGVADPQLGLRVLDDLNRVLGVIKLASPKMAPQPGRLGIQGMGTVGAGTTMAAATGQNIQGAVPLVYLTFGVSRLIGKATANYLTTGNKGMLHAIGRAFSLARIAGTNAAAAEAARAAFNELKIMSEAEGTGE